MFQKLFRLRQTPGNPRIFFKGNFWHSAQYLFPFHLKTGICAWSIYKRVSRSLPGMSASEPCRRRPVHTKEHQRQAIFLQGVGGAKCPPLSFFVFMAIVELILYIPKIVPNTVVIISEVKNKTHYDTL